MTVPFQCSPYQTVTSKIYRLKQHFLPPATTWRFTKITKKQILKKEVVIQSDCQKENEYIYMEK